VHHYGPLAPAPDPSASASAWRPAGITPPPLPTRRTRTAIRLPPAAATSRSAAASFGRALPRRYPPCTRERAAAEAAEPAADANGLGSPPAAAAAVLARGGKYGARPTASPVPPRTDTRLRSELPPVGAERRDSEEGAAGAARAGAPPSAPSASSSSAAATFACQPLTMGHRGGPSPALLLSSSREDVARGRPLPMTLDGAPDETAAAARDARGFSPVAGSDSSSTSSSPLRGSVSCGSPLRISCIIPRLRVGTSDERATPATGSAAKPRLVRRQALPCTEPARSRPARRAARRTALAPMLLSLAVPSACSSPVPLSTLASSPSPPLASDCPPPSKRPGSAVVNRGEGDALVDEPATDPATVRPARELAPTEGAGACKGGAARRSAGLMYIDIDPRLPEPSRPPLRPRPRLPPARRMAWEDAAAMGSPASASLVLATFSRAVADRRL